MPVIEVVERVTERIAIPAIIPWEERNRRLQAKVDMLQAEVRAWRAEHETARRQCDQIWQRWRASFRWNGGPRR